MAVAPRRVAGRGRAARTRPAGRGRRPRRRHLGAPIARSANQAECGGAGAAHQPRSASLVSSEPISRPGIGRTEAPAHLGQDVGVAEVGGGLDDGLGPGGGVVALEDARADEHGLGAELHDEARRRPAWRCHRRRTAAPGSVPGLGDLLHERERGLQLLGPVEQLGGVGLGDLADVAEDRAQVADGLDDVAGAGLALRADHARALGDAPQRLAEVGGAAHERHGEGPLVDVVGLVGRGEHLGLVDVVDAERLRGSGPRRSGRCGPWP